MNAIREFFSEWRSIDYVLLAFIILMSPLLLAGALLMGLAWIVTAGL